jgi:nucleotide-binding universal stress UspA family protein
MRAPDRILAAVDFSDRSRVSLGFAGRLACTFNAELRVMHALDPLLSAAAENRGINLAAETEDELRSFAAGTRPVPRCPVRFDVIVGPPSTSVVNAAERECADVIVLSAHGMSGVRHALLGSTTEGVLRRSNVSVLVVPDDWTPAEADRLDLRGEGPVIVGVDFRIPSIEAATDGVILARRLGSELVLAHVVPEQRVLPRWRDHADAALRQRRTEAQQHLERLRDTISGDLPTQVMVTQGRVASSLAEEASRHAHGLLVVGRTVNPHGAAPPGRTAYRALIEAQLPVLMHVAR